MNPFGVAFLFDVAPKLAGANRDEHSCAAMMAIYPTKQLVRGLSMGQQSSLNPHFCGGYFFTSKD